MVEIQDIGHRGVGIGRHGGKVVMVPFSAPGDRAEVQIVSSHKSYCEARVVRLVEQSPLRRVPPCPYFGRCGGCQLQHLELSYQRSLKERLFRETMTHRALVDPGAVGEIMGAPEGLGYRSRLDMHLTRGDKGHLGFMEWGSRNVVPVRRCLVASLRLNRLLPLAQRLLLKTTSSHVTRVEMACDASGRGATLTLYARGRDVLSEGNARVPWLRGLYTVEGRGGQLRTVWEKEGEPRGVVYHVPDPRSENELSLAAWPGVFRQVNPAANRMLVSKVLEWAAEAHLRRVLDLYAGMGNLSLPVSSLCEEVTAVEINALAVDNGRENCRRNGVDNVRWVRGSAKRIMGKMVEAGESFDLLILDPPRAGAREVIEEMVRMRPERIVYVSCDPATLARDLRDLVEIQGQKIYRVRESFPVDMFPQTFHLESVTLLERL